MTVSTASRDNAGTAEVAASYQLQIDRLERRYRRIYPLRLFLDYFRQMAIGSAIGLVLAATVLLLQHVVVDTLGGQAPRPNEIQVFLVTALASCLTVGYASMFAVAVQRFWRFGGLLALALAGLGLWTGLNTARSVGAPVLDILFVLSSASPLIAGLLGCAVLATLGYYVHLIWVLLRSSAALLLGNARERAILKEGTAGKSATSGWISRFWGFPPLYRFARRSVARYGAIITLSVICALLFSIAAVLPIVLWGAFDELARVHERCGADAACISDVIAFALSSFLFPWGLVGGCLLVGWAGQRLLQRLLRFSLESLQEIDTRSPILFLRAFRDDQVPLRAGRMALFGRLLDIGRRMGSLDQLLLEEATPCGPVVALGNPNDKRPPYGAARGYFDHKTWQEAVDDLAIHASLIVICVDDSEGVWWEVERLLGLKHLGKTLFVLHPRYARAAENGAILRRLAEKAEAVDDNLSSVLAGAGTARAVVGFFQDRGGRWCIARSSMFTRFTYLLTLRAFMRERLGLLSFPLVQAAGRS